MLFRILCLRGAVLWHVICHLQIAACCGWERVVECCLNFCHFLPCFFSWFEIGVLLCIQDHCLQVNTVNMRISNYAAVIHRIDMSETWHCVIWCAVLCLVFWRHYSPHVSTNTATCIWDSSLKCSEYWNSLKWDLTINFGLYHEVL